MPTFTKKTKIIATIGPTSEVPEVFARMLQAGVDIARCNLSHGDHQEHSNRMKNIRDVSAQTGMPVKILLDLSGPKIRIGDFASGSTELIPGESFILSGEPCEGDSTKVHFGFPDIIREVKPGQLFMLDDGRRTLVVVKVEGNDIHTTVIVGGKIKGRRGVNLPGAFLSMSALTEKDKVDLAFGIAQNVDYVALSFVRTANDIEEVRALITSHGGSQPIIAKIETPEAVERIDEIMHATDAIMVARGDLAIEIGHAKVPAVQRMLVQKAHALGKPVIIATQMLESMIAAPVPTRAEVSDIATAVYMGADATMLSEESALGQYCVEAVSMMQEVIVETERDMNISHIPSVEWKSQ